MNPHSGEKELLLDSLYFDLKKKSTMSEKSLETPKLRLNTSERQDSVPDREKKKSEQSFKKSSYPSKRSFSLANLESFQMDDSNQEIKDESSIIISKPFDDMGTPNLLGEKEDFSARDFEDMGNSASDLGFSNHKELSKTDVGSSLNKKADSNGKSLWITEDNNKNPDAIVLKGHNFSVELMKNNTEEGEEPNEPNQPEPKRRFSSWGQKTISPKNNRRKSLGVIGNQTMLKKLKKAQTKSNKVVAEESLIMEHAKQRSFSTTEKKVSRRQSLFNLVGNFFGKSDNSVSKDNSENTPKFVKSEEKRDSRGSMFKRLMTGKRDSKKENKGKQ